MKLYHGTSGRHLKSILKTGIKPRGKNKSTWMVPSHPDMTYFSVAYPLYYALNAVEKGEKCLIVEIETRKIRVDLLHPDEDYIAQVIAGQTKQPLSKVHKMVVENIQAYQDRWEESLEKIGNCSFYKKVYHSAITRYCLFDPATRPVIKLAASDPTITVANFLFCGKRYINLVEWLFGDRKELNFGELEALNGLSGLEVAGKGMVLELQESCERNREAWAKESQDRTGIEVVETIYEGRNNQERMIHTVANRMIKGFGKSKVSDEAEEAVIAKYEKYIVKAIPYINQHMRGSSAAFGAAIAKAMIKYGIDKGSKFGEALRDCIWKGTNDPAFVLYNMQARGKKRDAVEWYEVCVTAARAHCEGRPLTEVRPAGRDFFAWDKDWNPVSIRDRKPRKG